VLTGQSSAASFPTGPVMAEPFISPLGLTICASPVSIFDRLGTPIHPECTHDTGVVLEVEEDTVCSPPGLALADDDSGHDLLPELRLSLLDGGHDHVTNTGSGQAVKTSANALDGDDVEVTGAGVVAAVHDCAAVGTQLSDFLFFNVPFACSPFRASSIFFIPIQFLSSSGRLISWANVHRQTQSHLQLGAGNTTTSVK